MLYLLCGAKAEPCMDLTHKISQHKEHKENYLVLYTDFLHEISRNDRTMKVYVTNQIYNTHGGLITVKNNLRPFLCLNNLQFTKSRIEHIICGGRWLSPNLKNIT